MNPNAATAARSPHNTPSISNVAERRKKYSPNEYETERKKIHTIYLWQMPNLAILKIVALGMRCEAAKSNENDTFECNSKWIEMCARARALVSANIDRTAHIHRLPWCTLIDCNIIGMEFDVNE